MDCQRQLERGPFFAHGHANKKKITKNSLERRLFFREFNQVKPQVKDVKEISELKKMVKISFIRSIKKTHFSFVYRVLIIIHTGYLAANNRHLTSILLVDFEEEASSQNVCAGIKKFYKPQALNCAVRKTSININ